MYIHQLHTITTVRRNHLHTSSGPLSQMNLSSDESSDEFSSREPSDIENLDDVEWEDVSVSDDLDSTFTNTFRSISKYSTNTNGSIIDSSGIHKTLGIHREEILPTQATKKRRLHKISHVSTETQKLLSNLHKSHLLLKTCHNIIISNSCSSDTVLLHLALSLVPSFAIHNYAEGAAIPTVSLLEKFVRWFHSFTDVKAIRERRGHIRRLNEASGAPTYRQRSSTKGKRSSHGKDNALIQEMNLSNYPHKTLTGWNELRTKLVDILLYLSPTNDENPEYIESFMEVTPYERLWLFISMTRSIGWRVRYCSALNVISLDLTPNHPLLALDIRDVIRRLYDNQPLLSEISKSDCSASSHTTFEQSHHVQNSLFIESKTSSSRKRPDIPMDEPEYYWAEILCQRNNKDASSKDRRQRSSCRWTHVDPLEKMINEPMTIQNLVYKGGKSTPLAYAVGVEHAVLSVCKEENEKSTSSYEYSFQRGSLTDITPRYSKSWSQTLILRGATKKQVKTRIECEQCIWWTDTIQKINNLINKNPVQMAVPQDIRKVSPYAGNGKAIKSSQGKMKDVSVYDIEQGEFKESISNEPIPTNKIAFKNHPLYVIPSVLNINEVLRPQSSQKLAGFFKGERVFMRSDVSLAIPAKQWLYRGRKVKDSELAKPVKTVKGRKKTAQRGFKPLKTYGINRSDESPGDDLTADDSDSANGMVKLYGDWQTDSWTPPYVGPDDPIPVNEHKNVELALIPRGLIHMEQPRMAIVAKKLAIPYAPCLIGFEGFGGNRAPMIRGIVVHEGNEDLLLEAYAEWESKLIEDQVNERQTLIVRRWKHLVFAALTHDRLVKKYAND